MDIENFNQCLHYLQNSQGRSLVEKFIPLISTLGGVAGGFLLTQAANKSKEKRATSNKIMCCKEEIQRIQELLNELLKETLKIMPALVLRDPLKSHSYPHNVGSLYLAEYFTEIAHKFTIQERRWIQTIIQNIESINAKLPTLREAPNSENYYKKSIEILNITNISVRTWKLCENILITNDTELDIEATLIAIGCSEDQVANRNLLIVNANNSNNTLAL